MARPQRSQTSRTLSHAEDRVSLLEQPLKQLPLNSAPEASRFTSKEVIIVSVCSLTTIVANLGVGTMPLLIPIEITSKKYTYSWTGILFLLYGLVVFTCELLQSKIVPVFGTKRAFVASLSVLAVCYLTFGLLDLTNNENVFAGVACTVRILEGLCYSGLMNSIFTILCLTIPEKAILGIGLIDGLIGVGYAFGPLFSGGLYAASGFTLPYAIISILLLLCACIGHFVLPSVHGQLLPHSFGNLKYLYKDRTFSGCLIIGFAMGIVVGFLEATLEVYLSKFNKGTVVEGSVFFVGWICAAISSPIWGWILRKADQPMVFLLAGPVVISIVFTIFGPFPGLEKIGSHLGLSVACLIVMTVTTSMSLLAAIDLMLKRADARGIENNIVTYAFISAMWLASLYLGEGIGGIISGTILDNFCYDIVAVALIVIELSLVLIAGALILIPWRRCYASAKSNANRYLQSDVVRSNYEQLD